LLADTIHSSFTILSDMDIGIDLVSSAAASASSTDVVDASSTAAQAAAAVAVPATVAVPAAVVEEVFKLAYSKASYYTTLGLYVLSFPGIWSQIKRSTKAKMKRRLLMVCHNRIDFFTATAILL